jgi:putative phage-type endonuclease|tara:strand:+ start:627 stop:1604 length:978 start_codon:yes stop_codon:yes gene_type:complete
MEELAKNFAVNDLIERKKGIGGSDAGTAIGVNPWKSPYQLYLEKTGARVSEDISDKPAVKRGVRLEPEIIKWVKEDLGITIRKDNTTHISKEHPFLFCHNDGTVVGTHRVAEVKSPSIHMREFWGEPGTDSVPQYYLAQGVHALAIQPEMEGVDFFAYFDPDILHFRLERKQSLIDAYIAKVTRFWDFVLNKVPPPPQDENDLIHKYFKKNGKFKSATPDIEKRIANLIRIKAKKKTLDLEEKEEKFQIKNYIEHFDGINSNLGKVTLSRVELKAFQEKGFMKTDPELYEEYCTVLDEKRLKVDHPEKYEKHVYSKQSTRLILPK